jgi:hypothetical protein
MKRLSDYLPSMQTEDVLAATEEAKVQARTLLEDQGVAMLALLLADVLADVIQQGTAEIASSTSTRMPAAR